MAPRTMLFTVCLHMVSKRHGLWVWVSFMLLKGARSDGPEGLANIGVCKIRALAEASKGSRQPEIRFLPLLIVGQSRGLVHERQRSQHHFGEVHKFASASCVSVQSKCVPDFRTLQRISGAGGGECGSTDNRLVSRPRSPPAPDPAVVM